MIHEYSVCFRGFRGFRGAYLSRLQGAPTILTYPVGAPCRRDRPGPVTIHDLATRITGNAPRIHFFPCSSVGSVAINHRAC
jgi:hypothetical protein